MKFILIKRSQRPLSLFIAAMVSMFFCQKSFAQYYTKKIMDSLDLVDKHTIDSTENGKKLLVSKRGLNNYFGNKIGYFLTGEDKSNVARNFVSLSTTDSELEFGHNRYKEADDKRIVSVFTYGFKAKASEKFSEIFSSSQKLSSNIGITFKYTWLGNGTISFDTSNTESQNEKNIKEKRVSQKYSMDKKRRIYLLGLENELADDSLKFSRVIDTILTTRVFFQPNEREEIANSEQKKNYEKLKEDYEKKYYDKEAELLDVFDAKNIVRVCWLSFSGYIPLNSTSYQVTDSLSVLANEKRGYLIETTISPSLYLETRCLGKFFFNVGINGKYNNTVNNEDLTKYTVSQAKAITGHDSLYTKDETEPVYLGKYEDLVTGAVNGQFVYFPKINVGHLKKIVNGNWGLSGRIEQKFDGTTDKTNVTVGIPWVIKNEDDESIVNIEVQFKFNDTARWTKSTQNYSFGLNAALPFSSIFK